jgi:hypothetical protein
MNHAGFRFKSGNWQFPKEHERKEKPDPPTIHEFENNGKVMRMEMPAEQARDIVARYEEALNTGKDVAVQFYYDDNGNPTNFSVEAIEKEVEQ